MLSFSEKYGSSQAVLACEHMHVNTNASGARLAWEFALDS